jgi:multidrug efflux pump subunit AcrA (membrane-fusion protein)
MTSPPRPRTLLRTREPAQRGASALLFLCAGIAAVAALFGARVAEYAEGPIVIRLSDRRDVIVTHDAVVAEVLVAPGQVVAAGAVLARFVAREQQIERERLERELELRLIESLRDPAHVEARAELARLGPALALAREREQLHELAAPVAGVVNDVRLRAGQRVAPGAVAVTIRDPEARFRGTAFLPGRFRPLLAARQSARIELDGYPRQHLVVELARVHDDVIGPDAARSVLGAELGPMPELDEAVVEAEVVFEDATFRHDGRDLRFFDGMRGTLGARVGDEPVFTRLIPALRGVL